jgi:hypothetical protein
MRRGAMEPEDQNHEQKPEPTQAEPNDFGASFAEIVATFDAPYREAARTILARRAASLSGLSESIMASVSKPLEDFTRHIAGNMTMPVQLPSMIGEAHRKAIENVASIRSFMPELGARDHAIEDGLRSRWKREARIEQATLDNAEETARLVDIARVQASRMAATLDVLRLMNEQQRRSERRTRVLAWMAIAVGSVAAVAAVVGLFIH